MHAPQPWEENAKRWLNVEGVPPTHTVGKADMGKLVVFEGAEYWACVRVEAWGAGMGRRHREPAQEAAIQGPGLLQVVQGMPPVTGPGAQGAQVHDRGHPTSGGCVRGGNAATEGPGAGRLACSPKQHVVG